jgi:Holliday junction resolvase
MRGEQVLIKDLEFEKERVEITNKNYIRGRKLEYDVMKIFEKANYYVFRNAGSHGVADVIAIKDDEVVLIQCKSGKKPTKQERKQMFDFHIKTSPNIEILLAHKEPRKKIKFYQFDITAKFVERELNI